MSNDRVLSTQAAKDAIQKLMSTINGGFTTEITNLDSQGKILSDPNNWDGPLAQRFRSETWPQTKTALDKAKTELDELQKQLDQIARNIMSAGGGV